MDVNDGHYAGDTTDETVLKMAALPAIELEALASGSMMALCVHLGYSPSKMLEWFNASIAAGREDAFGSDAQYEKLRAVFLAKARRR